MLAVIKNSLMWMDMLVSNEFRLLERLVTLLSFHHPVLKLVNTLESNTLKQTQNNHLQNKVSDASECETFTNESCIAGRMPMWIQKVDRTVGPI